MVRIHGIAYAIIGAAVAGYSYYLDNPKFELFMWVGLALVAIGLIRLLIDSIRKPKKHKASAEQKKIVRNFCRSCGTALNDFQHFCHNCGQRAFHNKKI